MFKSLLNWLKPIPVKAISVQTLKTKLDSQDDLVIIDVRSKDEFRQGHIKGAKSIPLPDLDNQLDTLPKDRPIAFVCLSGFRSQKATKQVLRRGFEHVSNVSGGMRSWNQAGYPIKK